MHIPAFAVVCSERTKKEMQRHRDVSSVVGIGELRRVGWGLLCALTVKKKKKRVYAVHITFGT